MRARRTTLLTIAAPAAAYIVLLVLVAALWVKPPLLGWIGLAVVATLAIALTAGAVLLFPRMRRNVDAVEGGERRRLLVLADTTCPALQIRDSIAAALAGPGAEVLVVAPVLASPLHYLAGDETAERADAEARLAAVVDGLCAEGIDARGRIGDDDPVQALGDALAEFPAVEALVVTSTRSHWLEGDLFERARRLVPVLQHVQIAEQAVL
ncbi:MAG TPA: hypothetical protein VEH55_06485 [Gaiellaceae bacterium]|jgi:hypothetical protein|nr:hypothetical protein [Gaiellaceae bacterium]